MITQVGEDEKIIDLGWIFRDGGVPSTGCSILDSCLWNERMYVLLGQMDVGSRKMAKAREAACVCRGPGQSFGV